VGAAGDGFEHMETLTDGAARDERDAELRATFADATARQHEIVAEAEMDVAYVGSPIVLGDAGSGAAPGRRLPDEILDAAAVGAPRRLRDLIRHPGHTVLVLARADVPDDALVGLVGAVRAFADGSGLVDAVVVVAEGARRAGLSVEALDAGAAARLGVEATTLLVVRPDGYVGLRADDDHVAALERYQRLITGPTGPA
jgi:hypothetical protein